ncbi:hypothetical protein F2Q70_00040133 [Brassica cretica]|uniref:UspA domain-containing protein n=1 Tax=Brassica cretica TaxID=69181 RepID=A0A8S9K9C0_BRACR|nr:hypothetical protein F2Q70_00040133 [Brassica cretica]
MWLPKTDATTKGTRSGSVAIAIDNDKTSQNALKWTMENLTSRGQTLALIHVVPKSQSSSDIEEGITHKQQIEKETKHLFVSFHCFCSRKEINCLDVVLEDVDKVKAIVEYVTVSAIENLVLGAPSRNSFMRVFFFKILIINRRFKTDLPTSVSKAAPDFCNVYVIAKSKISSLRSSSRPAPYHPSVLSEFDNHETNENKHKTREATTPAYSRGRRSVDSDGPRSGFVKPPQGHMKLMGDFSDSESEYSFINASQQGSDISYISSGRPSVDRSSFTYDLPDSARTSRMSTSSEQSIGSNRLGIKFTDLGCLNNASTASEESGRTSCSYSSQSLGDVEAQMRRLRLELKQTMDMYSSACREALTARNELRGTTMGQGKEVKTRQDPQVEIQERGEIFFFYRPKVNKEEAHSVDDVQRLCIVMRPESGENPVEEKQDPLSGKEGSGDEDEDDNNSSKKGGEGGHGVEKVNIEKQILLRFIVMGKKTLPDPSKKSQPFWGFVEMVTKNVEDVKEALKGEEYQTKTRGHRHKPPARAVGEGIYRILRHKPTPTRKHHTHLVYKLEFPSRTEKHEPQESMNIEPEGSFLIQVRNPEQGRGGRGSEFRGLKRKRKAQFPAHLQAHLGHTRFGAADPPDFLNYEGCEFLLISASDDIEEELGVELESEGEGDESSCDLVKTFGDDVDATPLLRGTWD